MKISYNWLNEYIDTGRTPEQLATVLTSTGLEVESLEKYESIKGGMEGLVIGRVVTCQKHSDADKLSLTTVDIGADNVLNIVCGAPNVAAGQHVVVATVGTVLYMGDEVLKIKKSKIRGELSEGMICAEDEIGLGASHEGIIVLGQDAVPGTPAKDYFNIESDFVFEIGLTPNRIDAASHFGVARDLAASLSQNHAVKLTRPVVDDFRQDNSDYLIDVIIDDKEACKRYSGLTMTNVKIGESPSWLKNRLLAIGQKPINNVVDVTNFVMHETGQPLHAFDADQVKGKKVIVRTLPEGTKFKTLDSTERMLKSNDLMICNAVEGMCIAGVFGGIDSGVSEKTTSIFIESACFNPVNVRKTSRYHQLFTDSAFRFERGSDPNITVYALKRAALLIKQTAGGSISSGIVDVYPDPVHHYPVDFSFTQLDRLAGNSIEHDIVRNILSSLDIRIASENNDKLILHVPTYRTDVRREADVIEEILRIYGFNFIYTSDKIHMPAVHSVKPDEHHLKNLVSEMLASVGYNEIISNSITSSVYYDSCETFRPENTVLLYNPLSADLNAMRQTLLFGGLEAISFNINRKSSDLKLFEFGNCYGYHKENNSGNPLDSYSQDSRLALFLTGKTSEINWITKPENVSFYHLKSVIGKILARIGIDAGQAADTDIQNDVLSYGLSCSMNNRPVAIAGAVSKKILKSFDIDQDVFYAELNWNDLVSLVADVKITYTPLSRFPEVKRDLALLIDSSVRFRSIKKIAFKTEKKLLKRINLFDIYEGEKLGAGKKSYALSFYLQDNEKTLNDFTIDSVMQNLINAFEKELGAVIR